MKEQWFYSIIIKNPCKKYNCIVDAAVDDDDDDDDTGGSGVGGGGVRQNKWTVSW